MPVVAVTGAAGHVGAALVRALLGQGARVRALVHRDTRGLQGLDVEIARGDVRDPGSLQQAFAGAETVYHTAAYISVARPEPALLEAINVRGTHNVVEACLACGVRRLVHFSSVEALVDEPFSIPLDEDRPLAVARRYPPYPRSKAAADRLVRQGLQRGLDAVLLYPSAILGPYDYRHGLSNAGLLAVCRGRLWALVDGGFDWVDVRDVAWAATRAAGVAPCGGRYLLTGRWATLQELAELGHRAGGAVPPRLLVPLGLARAVAPFATLWGRVTGKRLLFTTGTLRPLSMNPRISRARAEQDLGYRPRPLEETVTDTLRWFARHPSLTG
ncbi:MAG: NAD-dependent epimerase/dehydratase family protein [Anaerolineae bacterium]|jgi:dihydroflavonol-4-reductase